MTATNHALTGALVGLSIGHPAAMPLAIASHFVLDALPHYSDERLQVSSKAFARLLVVEALLCFMIVLLLFLARPEHWLLAIVCAFLATSPDFMWAGRFFRARRGNDELILRNAIMRFHSWIQWFERPIGAFVEVVWFLGAGVLLANML